MTTSLVQRRMISIKPLGLAQVLSAAGDIHCYRFVLRGDLQAVEQLFADKFHWVVQRQPAIQTILNQP
jgi:hypothetical protein